MEENIKQQEENVNTNTNEEEQQNDVEEQQEKNEEEQIINNQNNKEEEKNQKGETRNFDFSQLFSNNRIQPPKQTASQPTQQQMMQDQNTIFQNPQSVNDGQNNFYVNSTPHQQKEIDNNGKNDKSLFNKTGSNIYDIQRSVLTSKEPINEVLKKQIEEIDKEIKIPKQYDDLKKKIESDLKELKPIKPWNKGYKNNFMKIVGDIFNKIDKDGNLDIADLKDWKKKSVKELQEKISKDIGNEKLNGKLKDFLKKANLVLDGIYGFSKPKFDPDEFNVKLTELTNQFIKKKQAIDENFWLRLLTIIIDFFTFRRTNKDLNDAINVIYDIRNKVESLDNVKNAKDHEIIMTMINSQIYNIKTIAKRQKIDMKEYEKVIKNIEKKRETNVDGINIIIKLISELGTESVVGFYQNSNNNIKKKIKQKLLNYINKETGLNHNRENAIITAALLSGKKINDINKYFDDNISLNQDQQRVKNKLLNGALSEERNAIKEELDDTTTKLETMQSGLLDIIDAEENKELTIRIKKAITNIASYYKNQIENTLNNINNKTTVGMPAGYTAENLLKSYLTYFSSDSQLILNIYKDKYKQLLYGENYTTVVNKYKKDFEEKNQRYEAELEKCKEKKKNKKTNKEEIVQKIGKENDVEILDMIINRSNVDKLKLDNWINLSDLINEQHKLLSDTIQQAMQKLSTATVIEPKTIMDLENDKNKIENSCIYNLLNNHMINSNKGGGGKPGW